MHMENQDRPSRRVENESENCNWLVRRWYPKAADFSLCTRGDIRRFEEPINDIHRLALGGKSPRGRQN